MNARRGVWTVWPAVAGLGLAVAIFAWLVHVGPLPGDRWSVRFTPFPQRQEPWLSVGQLMSALGTPLVAGATLLVVGWLVLRGPGVRALLFVAVACLAVPVNDLLKHQLGPTPEWRELATTPLYSHGANFPSGHVVYAVALVGSLAVLAGRAGRRDLVLIALGGIALMGPFRVTQGSHLPSDVLAGYLLGAGWLWSASRVVLGPRRPPAEPDA